MPNKNVPNGFYMFMLEEQRRIKTQTKRAPSMQELPAMCKDTWKMLSAAEKAHYDNLGKQEKARQRGGGGDCHRKDNQRQIIAHRQDPVALKEKKRAYDTMTMQKSWIGKELLDIVFYVIDFQVMYDERAEDHHLPMEIGLVSFTLRDGLQKHYHKFIDPGEVPQGNRHLAVKHSELTHQIPLNFEKASNSYKSLWKEITEFVEPGEEDEIPPLFVLSDHTEIVESCLDFIYVMSGKQDSHGLHKIYCMEDLFSSLIMNSGKTDRKPALSQIHDTLRQNIWDYTSSIRCSYHEELDCSHCSLSIVRRYCFATFNYLSTLLEFTLTQNHLPEEPPQQFTVLPPEAFGKGFGGSRRRDRFDPPESHRDEVAESPASFRPERSSRHPTQSTQLSGRQPTQMYVPPSVGRFEIRLSDDEDDDDDYDDDKDLKSTVDNYQLKELRKPKTPSMLQSMNPNALGRGMARGGVGQPMVTPGSSGGQTRPMMSVAAPANANQSQVRPPGAAMLNMGRGRGRGSGRGLPPQI